MLTGRESLLRVIGKPRRFLPNRRSILSASSSTSQCCLGHENVKRDPEEQRRDDGEGDSAESVNCPVCGASLPGLDNSLINSHLDGCLVKGSKRKLSQVTLLQLNFSRSKVKFQSSRSADEQVFPSEPNRIVACDTIHNSNGLDRSEEYANDDSVSLRNDSFASHVENLVYKDTAKYEFTSPPLLSDMERPKNVLEEYLDDCDVTKVIIPTLIVGRSYVSREELDPESRICLSRDPENVKDPNAIKVLYVDCGYDNMLGYIPRELAQYLSPLIDKFHLTFEGSITSVPQDSRASVPIQIVCKNVELCDQGYCDMQEFKSLWRNALGVVELAKTNSSGMTRYQRNLVLLIQGVLKSSSHLFTDSEIYFLEAFNSLLDDSKRLFARLYTRKGFMPSSHISLYQVWLLGL